MIDSAFYGIKWAHSMASIPSPTDNHIVEAVRSASKRIVGAGIVSRKEPISSSSILDIISKSNLNNPVELRNVTLYVLSFAGFFRFDDVSRIRRNEIFFNEGFMVVKVLKSKNDKLRRGDEVIIYELSSCACPVKLLKRYLSIFNISPDSKDLISRPISRGKGSCKLVSPDKPISYSSIREAFKQNFKSVGQTLPSLVCTLCVRVVPPWQQTMTSMAGCFSDTVAENQYKPKIPTSMMTWHKGFQFPNFLGFNRGPVN